MTKDQFIQENRESFEEARKLASEGIANAIDSLHGLYKQHPVAFPAAAAAGALGIGALHHMNKQHELGQAQHQAFQKAMHLFPELHSESPEKLKMLWSSALQVAPNMSKNPLLLGSWIKGLAKGYAGTHISPQDLKQLQDLETGMEGQAPRRESPVMRAGQAVSGAVGLAGLLSKMHGGQGR